MRTEPLDRERVVAPEVAPMPLMHCPHCGAENFTMDGWEDLDHCASCGKPLGELNGESVEAAGRASHREGARRRKDAGAGNAEKPRPA
jgi:hypothetical protein